MALSWNPRNWFGGSQQPPPEVEEVEAEEQTPLEVHNPNAAIFSQVGDDIEEAVAMRSVVTQRDTTPLLANPMFQAITNSMYVLPVCTDKPERIKQYRSIAMFPECAWCLDEICDDFIHEDKNGEIITLKLPQRRMNDKDLNKERQAILQEEFSRFVDLFQLRDDGFNLVKRFLIEGELAFENIISPKYPSKGIIGVKFLPAEYYQTLMNQKTGQAVGIVFDIDQFSEDIKMILSQSYLGSQQIFNSMMISNVQRIDTKPNCIPLYWPQVTYINSGDYSPDGLVCYSLLEKCKQAYHQLSLMQDAAVIRRVTRAPERLLFNISTGNMTAQYAEDYVRRFANGLKAKKVVGKPGPNGQPDIAAVYNPVSMLESYVFSKSTANDGTTVETVGSTANFDEVGDIEYFLRRLFKQFSVPFSRYKTPENVAERDETISYEEHAFACMLMRFQRRFALGLKKGFITDLKLRGIWDKYNLKDSDITVEFAPPILYNIYERQKLVTAQMDTYKAIVDQEEFSKTVAMKQILGMTDDEIEENFKSLIKEKQWVQLGDYYAEQLNSEGPAVFDSPIPIKGKEVKNPDEQDTDSTEGDEGGDEEGAEGEEGGEEAGGEEESGGDEGGGDSGGGSSEPTFGLGN